MKPTPFLEMDFADTTQPSRLYERVFNACWPVAAFLAFAYLLARVVWGMVT